MPHIDERLRDERIDWPSTWGMAVVHVLPLLAIFTGITWKAVALFVILLAVRGFFITAGYHRYFAHRSYRTNRVFQFVLAFGGTTAAQKGPLWWAGHHRAHHRYSDTPEDFHSPRKGFWFSHIGWILARRSKPKEYERIEDFAKFPELRFVDRNDWIGPWSLGVLSFLIAGLPGLLIGFFASTVVLWHTTFTVNSLAHVFGRRRYATDDTSRNSLLIALATGGEGWHNNHHHYPVSCRQGFYWWEIDTTWYGLKVLSWLGIVRDLRSPSKEVRRAKRIKDGAFDRGMYRESIDQAAAIARAGEPTLGRDRLVEVSAALREATETAQPPRRVAPVDAGDSVSAGS